MKKKIPEYLAEKQKCPAMDYRHQEGKSYCYAKTLWGGKRGGLRHQVPICDETKDYCSWKNKGI